MCYVCNCFAWTLDLIQRILTFCLSCWLAFAVCCGLSIAAIAGIAYGYNYCLAEYITLTRSDIRVYMRRGQFYDKPDIMRPKRRMGEDSDDTVFPYNLTEDYQQEVQSSDEKALSDKWIKDQEFKKYAEKLTKYSESRKMMIDEDEQDEQIDETTYKTGNHPATTILHSGSSNIVMRLFEPVTEILQTREQKNATRDYKVNKALDLALRKTTDENQNNIRPYIYI